MIPHFIRAAEHSHTHKALRHTSTIDMYRG
jgi:hypothetical protein